MKREPTTAGSPPPAGGLHVPATLGISVTELEAIQRKFTTQATVEADLKAMGIEDPKQPAYALPELDAKLLTTLDSNEYTEMYTRQLAWSNYLTPILAKVLSGLVEAENQMVLIKAKIEETIREQNKLKTKEDRLNTDDIKNAVLNDPVYQEAMLESQSLKQYKLRLEAAHEIAGRNLKLLSRQVEIRRQDLDSQIAEGGIGNRFGQPHRPIGGGQGGRR